jgi:hypothetical protein
LAGDVAEQLLAEVRRQLRNSELVAALSRRRDASARLQPVRRCEGELDRIHKEAVASLTPHQQRLLVAGALTGDMLTPHQQELFNKMDPYLKGLTMEQTQRLALYDQKIANQEEFNRGWQAGLESGGRTVATIKVMVVVGVVLMILYLLMR